MQNVDVSFVQSVPVLSLIVTLFSCAVFSTECALGPIPLSFLFIPVL